MKITSVRIQMIILLLLMTSGMTAQPKPALEGKKYIAKVAETCKERTKGGCMFYTYSVLEFRADSVDIYPYTNATCSHKPDEAIYDRSYKDQKKTYAWSLSKDPKSTLNYTILEMPGYNGYGIQFYYEAQLIHTERKEEVPAIYFTEETMPGTRANAPERLSINPLLAIPENYSSGHCNTPEIDLLKKEITVLKQKLDSLYPDPGSAIDESATYTFLYSTSLHWANFFNFSQTADYCAARINDTVSGKLIRRAFPQTGASFPAETVWIRSYGNYLIVKTILQSDMNESSSGVICMYYYEKK